MRGRAIGIIGGGAAGMMAAAALAESGASPVVTVLERNRRLGVKVAISGGGRCNVTTGLTDPRALLECYPRGARFLRPAMYAFPPAAVAGWFAARGVPLKTEADGRMFPVSDRGDDVVDAFLRLFAAHGVTPRTRGRVVAVHRDGEGRFHVTVAGGPAADGGAGTAAGPFDVLILTTGGSAYRQTGSTGDGYRIAADLGHTITPLAPSLGALRVREPWVTELAGVSLPDAALTLDGATGVRYRRRGPLLFTHRGVSGPAVFALSALAAYEPATPDAPLALRVALIPDAGATPEAMDTRLAERFGALGGRAVVNALDTLLPRSLCPLLCRLAAVAPETHAARVPRADRRRLAALIAALPLAVTGRAAGDEFVTAGGVSLDEVDPRTMASRLVPGLYLAGEVLDVDGFTGGFNLQAAWATGRLAGLSAGTERGTSRARAATSDGR